MSTTPDTGDKPAPTARANSGADLLWKPRKVSASRAVAQYSRFVTIMKYALPAVAGFLLLLVLVLPQFHSEDDRFRLAFAALKGAAGGTLNMVNARYMGTDDKGQPFTVKAQAAHERSATDKTIELKAPQADIKLNTGASMNVVATAGTYDRNQQVLDLSGQVDLHQTEGYEMHTTAAHVVLKDRVASGDAPVTGSGPFGQLEAKGGFTTSDGGNVVNFKGPAHVTFKDDKTKIPKTDAAPEATAPAGARP